MSEAAKRAIIIAGPNGAGKTTFATEFLPHEGGCVNFVNADLIAAGLSPFNPNLAAYRAGRLLLREIDEHVRAGEDVAFETTLSGRGYARRIQQWQSIGFVVELWYLRLRDVETAIQRVGKRVAQGGHDVPEDAIRRRFVRGWTNFEEVYRPLVNTWAVYDNSEERPVLLSEELNPVIERSRHPDPDRERQLRGAEAALLRAAARARETARRHGTKLVIWRDGKMCEVDPDEAPLPEVESSQRSS